jgi:hypothetical protein
VDPALGITTPTLPKGVAGIAYPGTVLTASSGSAPYTWSVTSGALPTGLTLDAATGAISGTPTTAGVVTLTVKVKDSSPTAQTATQLLSIAIDPAPAPIVIPPPLAIATITLPNGVPGMPYLSTALTASNGTAPYQWSVTSGALPAGLTLDPGTGAISGMPTTAGTQSFTVTATDTSTPQQTATTSLSIVIDGGTASTTSPPLTLCGAWDDDDKTCALGLPVAGEPVLHKDKDNDKDREDQRDD